MKKSDEAIALAESIHNGDIDFIHNDDLYYGLMDMFDDDYPQFGGFNHGREHRVIALCLYATILQDEGQ